MRPNALPNRTTGFLLLLATTGCGTSDRESAAPAEPSPAGSSRPMRKAMEDAAIQRLAQSREAFWAQYLLTDGAPGPAMLSFCNEIKKREFADVTTGISMSRRSGDTCQLIVEGAPYLDEVRTILARWGAKDLVDATNHLNVGVTDNSKTVFVNWEPYVPLEQIVGTEGRFLVGFDVKKVLGVAGATLRNAVATPFVIEADCAVDACAAYWQRPPGGDPVRIGITRQSSNIIATVATTRELVPRLHALLDASLGPGHQDGPATVHVHHHEGVRYEARDRAAQPVVDVIISPDKP
jgi:hypothetical protein